jgi:hypothetical protein
MFSGKGLKSSGKAIQQSRLAQAVGAAECTTTAEDGSEVPCSYYTNQSREFDRWQSHRSRGGDTRWTDFKKR